MNDGVVSYIFSGMKRYAGAKRQRDADLSSTGRAFALPSFTAAQHALCGSPLRFPYWVARTVTVSSLIAWTGRCRLADCVFCPRWSNSPSIVALVRIRKQALDFTVEPVPLLADATE